MTAALAPSGIERGVDFDRHRHALRVARVIPLVRGRILARGAVPVEITDELLAIPEFAEPLPVASSLQFLQNRVLKARDELVKHDLREHSPFLLREDDKVVGERLTTKGLATCIRQARTKAELLKDKNQATQRLAAAEQAELRSDPATQSELRLFPDRPWLTEMKNDGSFSVRREVMHEVAGVALRRLRARKHELHKKMRRPELKQA